MAGTDFISGTTISSDNISINVTFNETVYNTNGGTGDLEVSDFVLSISGGQATLSQSTPLSISSDGNVYTLELPLTGTPDGTEIITVVPEVYSIYDGSGNIASTSQSNNTISLNDKVVPTISQTTISTDNNSIDVTFSEAVYNTNGGTGDLEVADFVLSISGGQATLSQSTPSSISISGNVYTLVLPLTGTPDGSEIITVVPEVDSIYDGAGNIASTSQSNNTITLYPGDLISGTTISSDNTSIDVTFSETVYNTNGGTGDLEVSDFVLSISGGQATLSQSTPSSISISGNVYTLVLPLTGTPDGSEIITVVPEVDSIYDGAGNIASTSQSNNTITLYPGDLISGTTISSDNTSIDVTFSETVYNTNGGTGDLEVSDFVLSISGGQATLSQSTPSSISISGNVYTLELPLTGTPDGTEIITVNPAVDSIYNGTGNIASTSQSNNTISLNDKVFPTISQTTISSDNISINVTFNETVYNTNGGTGDLEVSDFVLSISGGQATLSQSTPSSISISGNVYTLVLPLTGTPDGSEIITVVPEVDSIYDGAGNIASTTQSNNTVTLYGEDFISGTTISSDNTSIVVTFRETVYNTNGGTGDLEVSDFVLSISGGQATLSQSTPSSISISGNVYTLVLPLTGTADGSEIITVNPAVDSIYNGTGNIISTSQSNNTISLNDKVFPTISQTTISSDNISINVTFNETVYNTNGGTGDLEVSDFVLSISGGQATLSQSTPLSISSDGNVYTLELPLTGTPDGTEIITVVPEVDSIYDGSGKIASTSQSNNTISLNDKVLPTISQTTISTDNNSIDVTFSEAVYNTNGGTGNLEVADFVLSISGGQATLSQSTPSSISISGNVYTLVLPLTGSPDGSEIITVVPEVDSIYDGAGNIASTSQSNNTITLYPGDLISGTTISSDNTTIDITFREAVYNTNGGTGVLEVSDFVLSISGGQATLSQSTPSSISISGNVYTLVLPLTGTADGSEIITVNPAVDSIYNGTGNIISTSQSNNTISLNDKVFPTISQTTISSDNISINVTFNETLYNTNGGTGDLEVSDFVLSISGGQATLSQSTPLSISSDGNIYTLGLPLTGTPDGSEIITVVPAVDSIYDSSGNVASISQSNNTVSLGGEDFIIGTTISSDNSSIDVTFSESVYNSDSGSGDLEVTDFSLSISGGTAVLVKIANQFTSINPLSITPNGNVYTLELPLVGIPNGTETITVSPSVDSIYNITGNSASSSQSNNTVILNNKSPPTISTLTLSLNNSTIDVTFSESVYNNDSGNGDLDVFDFVLSISGGTATLGSNTPSSISSAGNVYTLGFSLIGTPDGSEKLAVSPASDSIYNSSGNAAVTAITTILTWNGEGFPPLGSFGGLTTTSQGDSVNTIGSTSRSGWGDTYGWNRGMNKSGSNIQYNYGRYSLQGTTQNHVIVYSKRKNESGSNTIGRVNVLFFEKNKNSNKVKLGIFTETPLIAIEQVDIFQVYQSSRTTIGIDASGKGLEVNTNLDPRVVTTGGSTDRRYDYITTNTDSPLNLISGLSVTPSNMSIDFIYIDDTPSATLQSSIVENTRYYYGKYYGESVTTHAPWLEGYYGYTIRLQHPSFSTHWFESGYLYTQNLYISVRTQDVYSVSLKDMSFPTISQTTISPDNTSIDVTFSEDVYNTNGGTGNLEVADFVLSISGGQATLSQSTPSSISISGNVYTLVLPLTGTPDGSEIITVVPEVDSIYDGAGNIASTSQSNNTITLYPGDLISGTTISSDNTSIDVTFSETVYNTNGGTGDLEVSDFVLSISGGQATLSQSTPSSISISGNVYTLVLPLTGTADGSEIITVNPAVDSIYNGTGNIASTSQSNNTISLNDKVFPTISQTTISSDNISINVTFNETVYNTNGGTGDLEVSDFVLSISGGQATLSQSTPLSISSYGNVYTLELPLTGTPDGTEIITVVPEVDSIYDGSGNIASTSQSNNTISLNDKILPTISQTTISTDNNSIDVTFSEAVYNTNGGTGNLEVADFVLSISGGQATLSQSTPSSISISGNVYTLVLPLTGTPDGSEIITVVPEVDSIYDGSGNIASTSQSNNTVTLYGEDFITGTTIFSDNTSIDVTFNEAVYNSNGGTGDLEVADFVLSISGGTSSLSQSTPSSISISGNVYTLDLPLTGTPDGSEIITVVPAADSIYNGSGNIASIIQSNNTISLNDKVFPTISQTTISSDNISINVTFNETLYNTNGGTGVLEVSDFVLSISGGQATLSQSTPLSISSSGNIYTLGLPLTGTPDGSEIITVVPEVDSIYDGSGNIASTSQSNNTVTLYGENFITGTTIFSDNTSIDVTFNEAVYNTNGGTGDLEVADFVLSISGGTSSLSQSTPSSISISGNVYTLDLPLTGTPDGSEIITVVPAADSIYNGSGNIASIIQSNNTITLYGEDFITGTTISLDNNSFDVTFNEAVYNSNGGTGDLEVADFVLSISGGTSSLSQSTPSSISISGNVYTLGLSLTGTPDGSEIITVFPAVDSIYDGTGNIASTSQSNNTFTLYGEDFITGTTIFSDNTSIDVTFNEAVYNTNGGTGDLEVADFVLSISGGTSSLSQSTPSNISISGNVYTLDLPLTGTPDGSEIITVVPAADSIYNGSGNIASIIQSNNRATLYGEDFVSGITISSDNTSIDVTFKEIVYNNNSGTGDLEVSDFALSISGGLASLSQTTPSSISISRNVCTLELPLTGTPNGSEIITVVPVVDSIYNGSGNIASTIQSINNVTLYGEGFITGTIISSDNTSIDVTFNEAVYNKYYYELQVADFALSISGGTSSLSQSTPLSISISGNMYTLELPLTGTPDGSEIITVVPVVNSIYNRTGNIASTSQSNNVIFLNDMTPPTISQIVISPTNISIDVIFSEAVYNTNSGTGILEVSDFVLSISGGTASLSQSTPLSISPSGNLYTFFTLELPLTGTPDGSEIITVVPEVDSIFDGSGNIASTSQSNNTITLYPGDLFSGTTISPDNTSIDVTFSEAVYNSNGGTGVLEVSDFILNISGGTASLSQSTPSNISISGNVYTLELSLTGTPDGSEIITVVPAADSIYNGSGNMASIIQSNNTITLYGEDFITGTIVSSDNNSIDVTFNEAVYNSNGGTGDLEVADFALSISGGTASLSQSTPSSISISGNVYTLGLSLTGTPDGSEIITVVPAVDSIYKGSGNIASTSQSNNTITLYGEDFISGTTISSDNTSIDVTFSKPVYDTNGGTGDLEVADFVLSISGGTATLSQSTPSSISISGNVYTLDLPLTGTPDGTEIITVVPAVDSIYDGSGNIASTSQSNNNVTLYGEDFITRTSISSDNISIDVAFKEIVYNTNSGTGDLEVSDFVLSISGGPASLSQSTPSSISISGNVYTLGLPLTGTPNGSEIITVVPAADSIYNGSGNIASIIQSNNTITLYGEDFITGTTISSDNTSIVVTFSKAVYNTNGSTGLLEVADFVLSISGGTASLSQSTPSSISISGNVYTLGLSLTGTPDGTEIITVVPAVESIYDGTGNIASTSQSNNTVTLYGEDFISGTTISSDNTSIDVIFSKPVYNTNGGTGDLEVADFVLSISGGPASLSQSTPSSISISGNVYTLGLSLTGIPNGSEIITVVPAVDSIYDGSSNIASTSQSNNTVFLNDESPPTISQTTISPDNTIINVTFSKAVYNTNDGIGDLEVSDFVLSISGGLASLSQSTPSSISSNGNVYTLELPLTGIPDGSEIITVVPELDSIYDASGEIASTSQTNNTATLYGKDFVSRTIISSDNTSIEVTFSKPVYNTNGGTGDLEISDFVLSISGGTATLSQSTPSSISSNGNVYTLELPLTGTTDGSEIIRVSPAVDSIYNGTGNIASTSQSNNTVTPFGEDFISETTISSDNSSIEVTFSKAVYNTNGSTGLLEISDFILSISGGTASLLSSTPSSISISGNVYTLGLSLTGTPDGTEIITVVPAVNSIYDGSGDIASTSQFNNTITLYGEDFITGTTISSDNSSINVTFNEAVYNTNGGTGNLEVSDFVLSISGGTASLLLSTPSSISISGNVYTLGLSVTGTPDGTEIITVVPELDSIYDESGNIASTSQSNNNVTLYGEDFISETTISSDNSIIEVTFSKAVYNTNGSTGVLGVSDFVLSISGGTASLSHSTPSSISIYGNVYVLGLSLTGTPDGSEIITVVPAVNSIYDELGNVASTSQSNNTDVLYREILYEQSVSGSITFSMDGPFYDYFIIAPSSVQENILTYPLSKYHDVLDKQIIIDSIKIGSIKLDYSIIFESESEIVDFEKGILNFSIDANVISNLIKTANRYSSNTFLETDISNASATSTLIDNSNDTEPLTISISSPDVSYNSSTILSGIRLFFNCSKRTYDFSQDDIVISGGELVNFSGSGDFFSALLLVFQMDTYTIDIPEGVFSSVSVKNDVSKQFVFKKINPPIKFKKRDFKFNSSLTMNIFRLRETRNNLILTNIRASFCNNLLSNRTQLSLEDFLIKNKRFPRAILYQIVSIANKAEFNTYQTILNVHGTSSSRNFININKLLKDSLGKKIYNFYVVNQDIRLFNNIGKVNHYLITDQRHIMNRYMLVLASSNSSYLNDLTCPEHNSIIATNLITLLGSNDYKVIEVSSSSTDSFYNSNLNEGLKHIVDSINEQTCVSDVFSDYRKDINAHDNGACKSLGVFRLSIIPKVILSYMRDLNYFKHTYYGMPVGVYGSV